MGLEVRVHKDISEYVSKPMWGLQWRQIGALVVMVVFGGLAFVGGTVLALQASGLGWEHFGDASTWGMAAMTVVIVPAVIYGWWRPLGLKPGVYFPYVIRQFFLKGSVEYGVSTRPDEGTKEGRKEAAARRKEAAKLSE